MKKLYLFTNTAGNGMSGWENCYAMADNGKVLGGHICSNVGFMYGDLVNREDRRKTCEKHFRGKEGKAFEVVQLKPGELPPPEVIKKNEKLGKKAVMKENMAKVKVTMTED